MTVDTLPNSPMPGSKVDKGEMRNVPPASERRLMTEPDMPAADGALALSSSQTVGLASAGLLLVSFLVYGDGQPKSASNNVIGKTSIYVIVSGFTDKL